MKTLLALLLVMGLSFQAMAGEDRGGGNEIGLEFHSLISSALATARQNDPKLYQLMQKYNLQMILARSEIVVTDEKLYVNTQSGQQESTAVNYPSQMLIKVNAKRWEKLSDRRLRQGVAMHELYSLAGVESTGVYTISGAYVASAGLDTKILDSSIIQIPSNLTIASRFKVSVKDKKDPIEEVRLVIFRCSESYECREAADINESFQQRAPLNKEIHLRPGNYVLYLAQDSVSNFKIAPVPFYFKLVGGEYYEIPVSSISLSPVAAGIMKLKVHVDLDHSQNMINLEKFLNEEVMSAARGEYIEKTKESCQAWAIEAEGKKKHSPEVAEALEICKKLLVTNNASEARAIIKKLVGLVKISSTEYSARFNFNSREYPELDVVKKENTTRVKWLSANPGRSATIYVLPGRYKVELENESEDKFNSNVNVEYGKNVTFKP